MKTRVSVKYSTTRDVVHQLPSERLEDTSWNLCWENAGHNTAPHTKASLPRDGHAKELLVENVKQ